MTRQRDFDRLKKLSMAKGGRRPGAGRPKGSISDTTKLAQEYRALLVQEIHKNALPLIQALISKGIIGDVQALKEIHERSMGKVKDELDLTSGGSALQVVVQVPRPKGE